MVVLVEGKGLNVGFLCGFDERLEMLEGIDVDNDYGDENDILWYFNGRILGVDG